MDDAACARSGKAAEVATNRGCPPLPIHYALIRQGRELECNVSRSPSCGCALSRRGPICLRFDLGSENKRRYQRQLIQHRTPPQFQANPTPIVVASLASERLAQLGLRSVKDVFLCLRQVPAGAVAIKDQ